MYFDLSITRLDPMRRTLKNMIVILMTASTSVPQYLSSRTKKGFQTLPSNVAES